MMLAGVFYTGVSKNEESSEIVKFSMADGKVQGMRGKPQ